MISDEALGKLQGRFGGLARKYAGYGSFQIQSDADEVAEISAALGELAEQRGVAVAPMAMVSPAPALAKKAAPVKKAPVKKKRR